MDITKDKYIFMKEFYDIKDNLGTVEYNSIKSSLNHILYNEFNKPLLIPGIDNKVTKDIKKTPKLKETSLDKDILLFPDSAKEEDPAISAILPQETKKITILPPKEAIITNQNIKRITVDPETAKPKKDKRKKKN